MSRRAGLHCPRCDSTRFAEVSGLRGCGHNIAFAALCLFCLVPGLCYFLVKSRTYYQCRACGTEVAAAPTPST